MTFVGIFGYVFKFNFVGEGGRFGLEGYEILLLCFSVFPGGTPAFFPYTVRTSHYINIYN
jgi:hypothetical protein